MSNSFRHTRDARQSRTDVVVKGVGGEDPGTGLQFVWARYTTHAADYPCRYLPNGWGGEPYSFPEVGTVADAVEVATSIGDRVWGALGSLTWRTDGVAVGGTAITRFVPGDLIELTDPVEGQSATRYVIREVEPVSGSTGHPVWQITVGDVAPDVVDLMRGVTVIQPIQERIQSGGGSGSSNALGPAGVPSQPKDIPPTRAPTHPERNVFQPANPYAGALVTRPGWSDPAGVAPTYDDYTPQVQGQYYDAGAGFWRNGFEISGADGRPHPYIVDFGYISVDGTYGKHMPYTTRMRKLDLKGTGTVQVQKNGVDVGVPQTVTAAWQVFNLGGVGWDAGDDLHVVVSGTSGDGVSVMVWES